MEVKLAVVVIVAVSTIAILSYFWYYKDATDERVFYYEQGTISVSFKAPLPDCKDKKGSKIVIDLGANCGNSFIDLQQQHGPFDRSYLWELNPLLFADLEKLAKENKNVIFLPYGAWNKEQEITIDVIGQTRACSRQGASWDGTSFLETELTNKTSKNYNSSVAAKTIDFGHWYQTNICQQDEVSLKVDIEKAEYTVLAQFISEGLLCHPKNLLLEFHKLRQTPNTTQVLKQYDFIQNQKLRDTCFTSGFISTLEYLLDFCEDQPKLFQWL